MPSPNVLAHGRRSRGAGPSTPPRGEPLGDGYWTIAGRNNCSTHITPPSGPGGEFRKPHVGKTGACHRGEVARSSGASPNFFVDEENGLFRRES